MNIDDISLSKDDLLRYINVLKNENELLKAQNHELELLAYHDKLTGLFNRNGINYSDDCGSVIMMDVDSFKNINDTFGHVIGDQVLALIGHNIGSNIQIGSKAIRYGGEEFLIINKENNESKVIEMINRIQNKMTNIGLEIDVTLSFGYCINKNYSMSDCILYADEALLHSKDSGKNQYTSFEHLSTERK